MPSHFSLSIRYDESTLFTPNAWKANKDKASSNDKLSRRSTSTSPQSSFSSSSFLRVVMIILLPRAPE
ncbi:hypothetical protein Hanom_Chr04g00283121 [Helianthus anomalus]